MSKNGKFTDKHGSTKYYHNGKLHRDDGPAVIHTKTLITETITNKGYSERKPLHREGELWYKHGKLQQIVEPNGDYIYYKNGKYHRENGPATYAKCDNCEMFGYYYNGQYHRENGPAVRAIVTNPSMNFKYLLEWFEHGKPHNIYGPVLIATYKNNKTAEVWMKDGVFHNENGPAINQPTQLTLGLVTALYNHKACYLKDINIDNVKTLWAINGIIQKEDGPAVEYFDGTTEWWYNNIKFPTLKKWGKEMIKLGLKTKSEILFLILKYGNK